MEGDTGINVFDGYSRLRLKPTGEPKIGFPVRLEIKCGPFSVSVEGEARIDQEFRQSLKHLYESLNGVARLTFWSEEHSIVITGQGRGDIQLVVNVTDGYAPSRGRLIVEMFLDQSYLPGIIQDIAKYFPEPSLART
jgi:hypothetical protein